MLLRTRRRPLRGGQRPQVIVVPVFDRDANGHALDVACRLARERHSSLLLIAPLFVELELPLDAHFATEEAALRTELERKQMAAETYGVESKARIVRTRHGQLGSDLAAASAEALAALIVLDAPMKSRRGFRRQFSRDIWSVIEDAPCPVLIATESPKCGRAVA